jgi:hypothetical protein
MCRFEHKPIDTEPCEHCSDTYIKTGDHPAFQWSKALTNYDLLIRKSPDELAEWMAKYNDRSVVCPNFGAYDCHTSTCKDCWLDWLKQEVSE